MLAGLGVHGRPWKIYARYVGLGGRPLKIYARYVGLRFLREHLEDLCSRAWECTGSS